MTSKRKTPIKSEYCDCTLCRAAREITDRLTCDDAAQLRLDDDGGASWPKMNPDNFK